MTGFIDPTTEPLDDSGFMQDIGVGMLLAGVAIFVVVVVVRMLLDRRLSRAAKLTDHELVTLTGVVRASGPTLTAPLSGRACVAHRSRAIVVGEPGSSEGRSLFGQVPAGIGAEPIAIESVAFTLETSHGPIAIAHDKLELAVTPDRVVPGKPNRERAFLDRFGLVDKHDRAGFDEIVIEDGAKIAIRGMLRIEVDALAAGERGYRDESPRRMRLIAPGDDPIKILRVW